MRTNLIHASRPIAVNTKDEEEEVIGSQTSRPTSKRESNAQRVKNLSYLNQRSFEPFVCLDVVSEH